MTTNVVVLGAGISGLTTAYELSRQPHYSITVLAKHMPGDYDIEYASPWAGASYMPVHAAGTAGERYERETWPPFEKLARECPEAGVHFQNIVNYCRNKDADTTTGKWFKNLLDEDSWLKEVLPEFRAMRKEDLPPDVDSGQEAKSVCINTSIYLPWLASQGLKNGVIYRRAIVQHIAEAADLHHSGKRADIVINCTGLGSLKLGGVQDASMYPARGQIVVVRNEANAMRCISGTDDGDDEVMYMMTRAAGGGCVLGGCYQPHNWESQPDPSLALRIMKRCVDLAPELTNGKGIEGLSVIRHSVGLRPCRKSGIRIDREVIDGINIVHNYGHAGGGYQCSYGCSNAVLKLVDQITAESTGQSTA